MKDESKCYKTAYICIDFVSTNFPKIEAGKTFENG